MVIYGVSFDMVGQAAMSCSRPLTAQVSCLSGSATAEAAAILMKLQGASTPRPMTHDPLCDMLGELDRDVQAGLRHRLRENTFFASITLQANCRELEIGRRPSERAGPGRALAAPRSSPPRTSSPSRRSSSSTMSEDTEEVVEKFQDFPTRCPPKTSPPASSSA